MLSSTTKLFSTGRQFGNQVVCRLGKLEYHWSLLIAHELGHAMFGLHDVAVDQPLEHKLSLMGYGWDGSLESTTLGLRYRAACLAEEQHLAIVKEADELFAQRKWKAASERYLGVFEEDPFFFAAGYGAVLALKQRREAIRAKAIGRQVLASFPSRRVFNWLRDVLGRGFSDPFPKRAPINQVDKKHHEIRLFEQDRYRELEAVTEGEPEESHNRLYREVDTRLNLGQLDAAVEVAHRNVQLWPFNSTAWFQYVQALLYNGEFENAKAALVISFALTPEEEQELSAAISTAETQVDLDKHHPHQTPRPLPWSPRTQEGTWSPPTLKVEVPARPVVQLRLGMDALEVKLNHGKLKKIQELVQALREKLGNQIPDLHIVVDRGLPTQSYQLVAPQRERTEVGTYTPDSDSTDDLLRAHLDQFYREVCPS